MRAAQGGELFRELIEDSLLIVLPGGIDGADARFECLDVVGRRARTRPTEFFELGLDLFDVLLDLLLTELQGIDVGAQLAHALVEDGQLFAYGLWLTLRDDHGCGGQKESDDPQKRLTVHSGSIKTVEERCKS